MFELTKKEIIGGRVKLNLPGLKKGEEKGDATLFW